MLLPYYLLFLISILFLKINKRTLYTYKDELARLVMGTIFLVNIIGERSEPLSRVFNDQPGDIYIYIYINTIARNGFRVRI